MSTNSLRHYGVLGMHWGKRKSLSGKSGMRKSSSDKNDQGSQDHKRAMSLKHKKLKDMTNDELRDLTNRLNLESAYKKLAIRPKSKLQLIAEGMVNEMGKKLVRDVITSTSASILKKAMGGR